MKGRLFGVGVGPGDPELMTYKAVRTIEKYPLCTNLWLILRVCVFCKEQAGNLLD